MPQPTRNWHALYRHDIQTADAGLVRCIAYGSTYVSVSAGLTIVVWGQSHHEDSWSSPETPERWRHDPLIRLAEIARYRLAHGLPQQSREEESRWMSDHPRTRSFPSEAALARVVQNNIAKVAHERAKPHAAKRSAA